MGDVAKGLFGGGDKAATRAAEQAKALQAVANDRQLAALNADDTRTNASRRAPRGRRLLLSNESSGLSTTLGG